MLIVIKVEIPGEMSAEAHARAKKAYRERNKARSDGQIEQDRLRLHPDGTKKCGGECQQFKAFDQFAISRRNRDGLRDRCKICQEKCMDRIRKKRSKRTRHQMMEDAKRLRASGDKYCFGCEQRKPLAQFSVSGNQADGHSPLCRLCCSIRRTLQDARRAKIRDEVRKQGCITCGLKDIRCIDLAHRNRDDKLRGHNGYPIDPCKIRNDALLVAELKLVDPMCANCHADATNEENHRHPPSHMVEINSKRRVPINQEKTKRGACIDCKLPVQDRFWIFDFDHVRGEKVEDVSQMIHQNFPEAEIIEEMTKCDLRCKNCHRIATHERRKNKPQQ